MRFASWNVNSLNVRLSHVIDFCKEKSIDTLLLQELKLTNEKFPFEIFRENGWNAICNGQKTYNGVAIISKHEIINPRYHMLNKEGQEINDEQSRYIEAEIHGYKVVSIYLPNGNPCPGEKFDYKISWMKNLIVHCEYLLKQEIPIVIGGDYNIIPYEIDCYDISSWENDALWTLEARSLFYELINLGFCDAYRKLNYKKQEFTFWDYQGGAWQKNNGIRIDHFLLSPEASDKIVNVFIDKKPRSLERPSDHTPIICELK